MELKVPLFPLPKVVLFPRNHLPLHVFEHRYRVMLKDVLEGDNQLAICQLKEGYQDNYFGAPPVYRTMTLCRVLFADKLVDDRYNILVEGIERIQYLEEVQTTPYRIARVRAIPERVDEERKAETMELMQVVAGYAETVSHFFDQSRRSMSNLINTHRHPAIVADVVTSALVRDAYARQSILNEEDVLRRLKLVLVQLRCLAGEMKKKGIEVDLPAAD